MTGNIELVEHWYVSALRLEDMIALRGINRNTLLHFAVLLNKPIIFKKLLALGIDLNARNASGESVLHLAAHYGQSQFIDLIAAYNPLWNQSNYMGLVPLHIAIQAGYVEFVKTLLPYIKQPNITCNHFSFLPISETDTAFRGEGFSALHIAIHNKSEKIVRLLLKHPYTNLNLATADGHTPLSLSVHHMFFNHTHSRNNSNCLRELLLADCTINFKILDKKFDAHFIENVGKVVAHIRQEIKQTQQTNHLLDMQAAANLLRLSHNKIQEVKLHLANGTIELLQKNTQYLPPEIWNQMKQYLFAMRLKEVNVLRIQ